MGDCGDVHRVETPFWQRQPQLPLEIQRFLRRRVEAALHDPAKRADLAWPTVLGAPALRDLHPEGLPESLLLGHAARMLAAVGEKDPAAAWSRAMSEHADTAEAGATGWKPHAAWGHWGPLVSLRCGWQLMSLTPLPLDVRYGLASGVSLFNHGLYHECHDALEPLWIDATGELKQGLQGLILLAAGYHHLQLHNAAGMRAVWEEAFGRLDPLGGRVKTPWGVVDLDPALGVTRDRLDLVQDEGMDAPFDQLWSLPRPLWTLEFA
jgi:hypothetical protein